MSENQALHPETVEAIQQFKADVSLGRQGLAIKTLVLEGHDAAAAKRIADALKEGEPRSSPPRALASMITTIVHHGHAVLIDEYGLGLGEWIGILDRGVELAPSWREVYDKAAERRKAVGAQSKAEKQAKADEAAQLKHDAEAYRVARNAGCDLDEAERLIQADLRAKQVAEYAAGVIAKATELDCIDELIDALVADRQSSIPALRVA